MCRELLTSAMWFVIDDVDGLTELADAFDGCAYSKLWTVRSFPLYVEKSNMFDDKRYVIGLVRWTEDDGN